MTADPVSWLVVEPGWQVVGSGGEELGLVDELVGDTANDIFSGLSVSTGVLRKPRFIPAERVTGIVEGEVRVDVDANAFERLDEYEPPASA